MARCRRNISTFSLKTEKSKPRDGAKMCKMRIAAMLLILVLLAGLAGAQQPSATPPASKLADGNGAPDDQAMQTFRSRLDEVTLFFTVTDKHGKFVKDLKEDQFAILDNTRPPARIMNFEAQTNL